MPQERQSIKYIQLTNELIGQQEIFFSYLVEEGVPLSAPDVIGKGCFDSHAL
ncbi:MAG: hypothetical protein EZS28_001485, partial [Streblomastix strix]